MAFEDVIDSVKDWLNNRLKNPYFASVVVVWLLINRIEIFGLFNFNDEQTMQDRLLWMQQRFHDKEYKLLNLWTVKGFSGTVIFSVCFGFITMIGFKFLKVISGIVYNFFDRWAIQLQKWDKPSKWKSINDFEDLQKEHLKEKEGFEKLRTELIRRSQESEADLDKIKREKDIAIQTHSDLKNQNGILVSQSENLNKEIQNQLKDNRELKEQNEKNNTSQVNEYNQKLNELEASNDEFRILYAQYGKGENFIEVTKIVSDLITDEQKITIQNKIFGKDPIRFTVKELYIKYTFNQQIKTLTAQEEEIVVLVDGNSLVSIATLQSEKLQSYTRNTMKIGGIFSDKWVLNYSKGAKAVNENVTINDLGEYFIDGKHSFNLLVTEIVDGQITMKKIYLDKEEVHSTEKLKIINNVLITGEDSKGFKLRYEKVPNWN